MNQENFVNILDARLERVKTTLTAKADEYARGDRLSNFKTLAAMMRSTPERALLGLVGKHIVALFDFVADLEAGKVQPYYRWDEKIGDIMAYMSLLDAMILERTQRDKKGAVL